MWICLALLEMACGFAPSFPDQIFADGTEMLISYDRPTISSWAIDSSNHNAAFVTSPNYLSDDKVATPTRFTWDVGSQTAFTSTTLTANVSKTLSVGDVVVMALFCPKTAYAIPAGVAVTFDILNGANSFGIGTDTVFVALNNGATAVIGISPPLIAANIASLGGSGDSVTITQFDVHLLQIKDGLLSPWAASGQTLDIGEFWLGTLQEFKNSSDPKFAKMGGPTERRSHSNQPQPLMQKVYRQLTLAFTPMSNTAAYDSSSSPSFDSVSNALLTAKSALVIPRLYVPGSTTVQDSTALNQLSIFGRPTKVGELTGLKDATGLWTASLTMEEAPP